MCFACDTLSRRGVLFALQNGQNFIDRCRLHGKFLFARFSLRCELCFCCFFFLFSKNQKNRDCRLTGLSEMCVRI